MKTGLAVCSEANRGGARSCRNASQLALCMAGRQISRALMTMQSTCRSLPLPPATGARRLAVACCWPSVKPSVLYPSLSDLPVHARDEFAAGLLTAVVLACHQTRDARALGRAVFGPVVDGNRFEIRECLQLRAGDGSLEVRRHFVGRQQHRYGDNQGQPVWAGLGITGRRPRVVCGRRLLGQAH